MFTKQFSTSSSIKSEQILQGLVSLVNPFTGQLKCSPISWFLFCIFPSVCTKLTKKKRGNHSLLKDGIPIPLPVHVLCTTTRLPLQIISGCGCRTPPPATWGTFQCTPTWTLSDLLFPTPLLKHHSSPTPRGQGYPPTLTGQTC